MILSLLIADRQPSSLHTAMDFVGHALQSKRLNTEQVLDKFWDAMRASAGVEDRAEYWWAHALQELAQANPARGCEVAVAGLEGKDIGKQNEALKVLSLLAKDHPDLVLGKIEGLLLDLNRGWRFQFGERSGLFQWLPVETMQKWLGTHGTEGARAIAGHLPLPTVDGDGAPNVHPLTEFVLKNWGDDEQVFGLFRASTHQLQLYTGDIAAQHRAEAARATVFLSHPIGGVRRWAEAEVARGEREARDWTIRMEEDFLQ